MERRRKATLPAVLGTPEHCGFVRRELVVCPPFWLLPRIETGDSFYEPAVRRSCDRTRRKMCLHGLWENLSEVMGGSVPFSLSAPLLCQTIVAIFCGKFEQFANKCPA